MDPDYVTLFQVESADAAALEPFEGRTIRFGNDFLLVVASRNQTPFAAATRLHFSILASGVPRSNLHLVVQKHGRFSKAHPEVPVLATCGRYLIVDVDPVVARRLVSTQFVVAPLPVPYSAYWEPPRPEFVQPSDVVSALLDRLDCGRIQGDVAHLVAFETRESTTSNYRRAAEWAADRLRDCGFHVELEPFAVGSGESCNVVAVRAGSGVLPRSRVLATAHLDSVGEVRGAAAPGADDNATGVAGVLEIARCLADQSLACDLELVLFGGEEQGLLGSKAYVDTQPKPPGIRGVINMDMIGSNTRTSEHTLMVQGLRRSQWMVDALTIAAHTYTDLRLQLSTSPPLLGSDHVSFVRRSIPAVLLIEGNGDANQSIHSQRDTLANLDYELMLKVLRTHLAFLTTACGVAH